MANIKSFPNNQDVYIGAEDVMKWLHGRTSGVFAADGNAAVSALVDSTMAVTVSDGLGWMANAGKDGVVWWIDNEAVSGAKLQLPIDPADGVLNRIDRIIVEWATTNYVDYPEVKVLKGTASSKATAPALTNNSTVRQISLAKINVSAGTTEITASMITDERLDASVCGLVTENVSIDTTTMQKQFEELLTVIQNELQELNAGTAALLKTGDTMQGTLNMGGNKIQNVPTPENESDAVNKDYADGKLSMELLWQNGSLSSSFADQTVSLDLMQYSQVRIDAFRNTSNKRILSAYCDVGRSGTINDVYTVNNASPNVGMRAFSVTETGVKFDEGLLQATNSTTRSTNNTYVVPYRIYGFKGVQDVRIES